MEPLAEPALADSRRGERLVRRVAMAVLAACITLAAWRVGVLTAPPSTSEPGAQGFVALLADVALWAVAVTGIAALALLAWAALPLRRHRRPPARTAQPPVERDVPLSVEPPAWQGPPPLDISAFADTLRLDVELPGSSRNRPAPRSRAPDPTDDGPPCDAASQLLRLSAEHLEREANELQANCSDLAVLSEGARRTSGSAAALALAAQRRALEISAALEACAMRHSAAAASLAGCVEIAAAHARALDQPGERLGGRTPAGLDILPQLPDPEAPGPADAALDAGAEARLVAELVTSAASAFDQAEAGWRHQRAAMHELAGRLATLAGEAAAIHRMVTAQVECSQFNAHASVSVSTHALRLCDDARRLVDTR